MPHPGEVCQEEVFLVVRLVVGMDVIVVLNGQMIVSSRHIQHFGGPYRPEVKAHVPSGRNVPGKGNVQLIPVSSPKKSRQVGMGRLRIIVLHAVW